MKIAIIGTGFSGICAAIRFKENGFNDFKLFEKALEVGGTWRDNTYPGAACDIKSHLYSFSFEPNPNWSRVFSGQAEILDYLKHCVNKYQLQQHIVFNWQLQSAIFNDTTSEWEICNTEGKRETARLLVLATGALHIPKLPEIDGIDQFKGVLFHSAQWNHQYDLKNKTVAVIGTGASAIQFVPEIVPLVKKLLLFQRTAPWILPKRDGHISSFRKWMYRHIPFTQKIYRTSIYWINEAQAIAFVVNPKWMKVAEKLALRYLQQVIQDEALRQKLTPRFTMGCKRVLLSNNYLPSLTQPNVEVITDAIQRVREHDIVFGNGRQEKIDAIICGTGFRVSDSYTFLTIKGRHGADLKDAWRDTPQAYLGTVVSGFPNLFLLVGPNTGLGHNSMIYMIEAQVNYLVDAAKKMRQQNLKAINVKTEVQAAYTASIHQQFERTVWNTGCSSWYLTPDGKNASLWTDFTFKFRKQTQRVNWNEYEIS
jgi:cation diffusion facilitator CzcD-associated flavoprotein CzcO